MFTTRIKIHSFVFAILLCPLLGCRGGSKGDTLRSEKVVAKVNGVPITEREFIGKAEKLQSWLNLNLGIYQERKKLLDDIITYHLLYQKALKEKIMEDPEFKELLANYYLRKKFSLTPVSDEEAREYYEKNKQKYDTVRVSHILIKPRKPKDKSAEDEAMRKAGNILVKALNGEDFSKLAKKYSQDTATAKRGGDLGYFPRGVMVKEFEEAAFSLKEPGDISKVIKSSFGFHILKLTDRRTGFETFKEKIKQKLAIDKERGKFEALIKELKKSADITVYEENLKNAKLLKEPLLLK